MIRSTCVYLIRDGQWLMLLRDRKQNDVNHGKYIGVGGKSEGEESFEECAAREVLEETGCIVHSLVFAGYVDFCYDTKEEELIAVYTCSDFTGNPDSCPEGTLRWVAEKDLLSLELWEGDRIFLKQMCSGKGLPFDLKLIYDDHGTLQNVINRKESHDE